MEKRDKKLDREAYIESFYDLASCYIDLNKEVDPRFEIEKITMQYLLEIKNNKDGKYNLFYEKDENGHDVLQVNHDDIFDIIYGIYLKRHGSKEDKGEER